MNPQPLEQAPEIDESQPELPDDEEELEELPFTD